ncbi:MAG: rRNA maturation RNase YbeY [Thermodesulfobacteriota bacterium]|nr:rRNA maturation RNase YbeY [Thermodesulfobacteriota bacterium]
MIQAKTRAVLNALGNHDAEISILVIDDAAIAELNAQYLNRSGPTNVIAFPMLEGDFADINPAGLLGDVVISAETAHREALAAGIPMEERFTELLVHGILHLLGYDHEINDADAAVMEAKTRELMEMLKRDDE